REGPRQARDARIDGRPQEARRPGAAARTRARRRGRAGRARRGRRPRPRGAHARPEGPRSQGARRRRPRSLEKARRPRPAGRRHAQRSRPARARAGRRGPDRPAAPRRGEAVKKLLAALLALAVAAPAGAVKAPPGARADAKRFGFDRATPIQRHVPSASASKAFHDFNGRSGGKWKVTFSPRTGLPDSLLGGRDDRRVPGNPDATARNFLAMHNDVLGVDPTTLSVDRQTHGNGHSHLLYRQSYKGIPVEFASVK